MRSRQYLIRLKKVKKIHAIRVYADRSVEIGYIESTTPDTTSYPDFERARGVIQSRGRACEAIATARDLGYPVEKEWL